MAIDTIRTDIEALAAARAEGRQVDPEIAKRVHERAERARQELLKSQGVLDIGVDLIRQARDAR